MCIYVVIMYSVALKRRSFRMLDIVILCVVNCSVNTFARVLFSIVNSGSVRTRAFFRTARTRVFYVRRSASHRFTKISPSAHLNVYDILNTSKSDRALAVTIRPSCVIVGREGKNSLPDVLRRKTIRYASF